MNHEKRICQFIIFCCHSICLYILYNTNPKNSPFWAYIITPFYGLFVFLQTAAAVVLLCAAALLSMHFSFLSLLTLYIDLFFPSLSPFFFFLNIIFFCHWLRYDLMSTIIIVILAAQKQQMNLHLFLCGAVVIYIIIMIYIGTKWSEITRTEDTCLIHMSKWMTTD